MNEQKKRKTKNDGVIRETGYIPRDILKKHGLDKSRGKDNGRKS